MNMSSSAAVSPHSVGVEGAVSCGPRAFWKKTAKSAGDDQGLVF